MSDTPLPQTGNTSLSVLQDAQGAVSSRRVAALIALGCLVVGFVAVLGCVVGLVIAGKALDASLMGLMGDLVNVMAAGMVGALGMATADRWAPK